MTKQSQKCKEKYLNNVVRENQSYQTVDVLYGSSGSPVFSDTGDLLVMQRRKVEDLEDPNWKVSHLEQGVSIKRIINSIYSHAKQILEDLFRLKTHVNNDVTPMDVCDT